MVGLIVINNQPIHGPCVTADEPSCEGVWVCVADGWWRWTGFNGPVKIILLWQATRSHPLCSQSQLIALSFHTWGQMERGKEKWGVEEQGRSGEKILVESEEEGWAGQERPQVGKWEKLLGGERDEKDKNKNKKKWTKMDKILVLEHQRSYFLLFVKKCFDFITLHCKLTWYGDRGTQHIT